MSVDGVFNPCARRALLLGAGAVGIAALAGCGGDDEPAPAANGGAPAGSAPATSAASSAAANPFDTSAAPGGAGEQAPPAGTIIATKDVPVGGGRIVDNNYVVVQPSKGTFKAYDAKCPHQGFTVDAPVTGSDVIKCPQHSSQFKASDGSLVRGPATRGLAPVAVKVQSGYVVQA